MERTNKKECPKCKSQNVFDIGNRIGDVSDVGNDGKYPEPRHPIFKCKDCEELFILVCLE